MKYTLLALLLYAPLQAGSQSFEKGKISDPVKCIELPDQSYCLFLPENYKEDVKWPVIMIFDPSARGRKGVEAFRSSGVKYGYILACSNNSRNGPLSVNFTAAAAMLADLEKRFTVDRSRIYASGFSGGSRFAMALAATNKAIAGVIGCGAGLPNDRNLYPGYQSSFDYYGLAGNRDMNYIEMYDLRSFFPKYTSVTMSLRTFDGGHDWPDQSLTEAAAGWLILKAMNKSLIPRDNSFTSEYEAIIREQIAYAVRNGSLTDAAIYIEQAARDFSGTLFGKEMSISLNSLRQSKEFRDAARDWNRMILTEQDKKEKYIGILSNISGKGEMPDSVSGWWKNETETLKNKRDHGKPSDSQMSSRLLNFISILCFEQGNSEYRQKRFMQAAEWFEICTLSDDANPSVWYNYSRSLAGLNKKQQSITALEKAVILGLNNSNKPGSDPVYDSLKDDTRFRELLKKMK